MKNYSPFFIFVLLITLFLSACQSEPVADTSVEDSLSPEPTSTVEASFQSSPIEVTSVSPPPTPTPQPSPTPLPLPPIKPEDLEPGKAAIVGNLQLNNRPETTLPMLIFLADFVWTVEDTDGAFAFNTANGITTELIGDEFQLVNIEPGTYVLLVGPTPPEAGLIMQLDGARGDVFEVVAGQVLDIEERIVTLP